MAEKARGKRGRNTRSRTPPVRIPLKKGQKAVNNKNNARAKQFSMPVSPLAKENGNGSKRSAANLGLISAKSFEDEGDAESDMTKDDDSDENNPGEPVSGNSCKNITFFYLFFGLFFFRMPFHQHQASLSVPNQLVLRNSVT